MSTIPALLTHNEFRAAQRNTPSPPSMLSGRWMEAVSHLDPKYGGLSAVVPQLASHLAASEQFTISIASFTPADETSTLSSPQSLSATHWPSDRSAWMLDRALRSRLREHLRASDGVHVHGLWESQTAVVTRMARSLGVPYIVSAHGMLEPWALASKGLKKRLYSALVERSTLERSACLHALTLAEARDYRRFGSCRPIAVIPNGVDTPTSIDPSLFLRAYPELRGKRLILFLGRLHPKKGLDILLEAWSRIEYRYQNAVLLLAGPPDESAKSPLKQAEKLEKRGRLVLTGMLPSAMKWSALANAHCFVLPSYSEGLSVAALEALAAGLPVILTHPCHLPEVTAAGAGWEIEPKLNPLIAALTAVLEAEPEVLAETSRRAQRLFQTRFSWPVVTTQMAELYRWVQGGPRPVSFPLLEAEDAF